MLIFTVFGLYGEKPSDSPKDSGISLDNFSDDAFDFDLEEEDLKPEAKYKPHDHLSGWNKACFKFNYWFLRKVVIPVSSTYKEKVPGKVRSKFTNFFYNLRGPVRVINCLFQGKLKQGERELGGFLMNTTVGVVGIFDPASEKFEIPSKKEDFGQTLGKWGVGPISYLQIPFLGPRTVRDFVTFPIDNTFTVDTYVGPSNFWIKSGINGVEIIDNSANNLENLKSIEKDAADPYTFVRDAYMQLREAQVKD